MDGFGLSRETAMPVPVSADTGVMAIGESSAMQASVADMALRDVALPAVPGGVDFHHRVRDALTVAENWSADAATPINRFPELSAADREKYTMPAEDRVLIHGQRDYFDCVAGPDVILHDAEFIVRPTGPFQTGICTTCPHVPPWGSSVDDAFVDALVANLRHVFVPVFDTSGYLIWTPRD